MHIYIYIYIFLNDFSRIERAKDGMEKKKKGEKYMRERNMTSTKGTSQEYADNNSV